MGEKSTRRTGPDNSDETYATSTPALVQTAFISSGKKAASPRYKPPILAAVERNASFTSTPILSRLGPKGPCLGPSVSVTAGQEGKGRPVISSPAPRFQKLASAKATAASPVQE